MRRSITLAALIGIATGLGAPDCLRAQTAADVAPVPGPYRAAPAAGSTPYANPARPRTLPYWMRSQPGPVGAPSPVFIPGWVWSQGGSNQGRVPSGPIAGAAPRGQAANLPQPGAGAWQRQQPPAYGAVPWGPPGYAPGTWPNAPYFAPRGYGAPQQPQR